MLCNRRGFLLSTCGAAAVAVGRTATGADPVAPQVRIGMLSSMVRDVNPTLMSSLSKPFNAIVSKQTGLTNELVILPTPDDLRLNMETSKIQFGVFHSFEFAWMNAQQPALQPLMLAAPQRKPIRSFLAVHHTNAAKGLSELKGKGIAIPVGTREYGRLYVDRQCRACGSSSGTFFSSISTPPDQEHALHDVVDNKHVQVALVDVSGLDSFASRHPVRNKRIRIMATSEPFPPTVVAYHKGTVDDATIRRFRDGMSTAHTSPFGKQLMGMWNISAFEPVPTDFSASLVALAKAYPPLPDGVK
ncbi:MAG: PhnD/SsuA/transferrin family substrate-binding protein [Gemmataceae bacterium]